MIIRKLTLLLNSLVVLLVSSGCQNLRPSQHPLVRLDHAHHFGATRIAFSPSGRFLSSGGFQGDIKIWSVPGGKLIKILKKHTRPVRGFAWINDDVLVSAAEDGKLLKWSLSSGKVSSERILKAISSMTWSTKAKTIITGHKNGNIRLLSQNFELLKKFNVGKKVLSVSASNDARYFAASTSNRKVFLFDNKLSFLKQLNGLRKKVYELRFSPNNNTLAGSTWFKIMLWDIESGKFKQNNTEHLGAIVSLDYHPSGKKIISLGRHTDANMRLSDVSSGKIIRRLSAHEYCGWNIRFSPNGRYVASSSEDEGVRLYDLSEPYNPTIIPGNRTKN